MHLEVPPFRPKWIGAKAIDELTELTEREYRERKERMRLDEDLERLHKKMFGGGE